MTPTNVTSGLHLVAIRAFALAAQYESFTRAGQALGITQGGISRHIASLEKQFGQALFIRRGPQTRLTPAGMQYYAAIRDAISTLEIATQQMQAPSTETAHLLVRSSMPTLLHQVLLPALQGFQAAHPCRIDVLTSLSTPLPEDEYDILISRDISLPHADTWELWKEQVVCIATPALLARYQSYASTAQACAEIGFILAKSRPDLLGAWRTQMGLTDSDLHIQGSYDHYFLALSACLSGLGLLVTPTLLAQPYLEQGLLVTIPNTIASTGQTYRAYINPQSKKAAHTICAAFCRWLHQHIQTLHTSVA
jgi:DNA-binding transcriptional LysR family regulator